jgi:hypothetical protein
MTLFDLFDTLQNSALSTLIRKQNHLFGAGAQLFHITGLVLVLSSVLLVSLRLLGVGLIKQSVPQLVQATSRFIWIGLGLLVISGIFIFLPAADHYYPNPIFWSKFLLLAIALAFHITWYRKVTLSDSPRPVVAKSTAWLALSIWFGVAYAGRFIGFY